MAVNKTSERGLTTVELLIASILVFVLILAAFGLLRTSWMSYENLVWQSKVNMEARRALDHICDEIRADGYNTDMLSPGQMNRGQINTFSNRNMLDIYSPTFGASVNYSIQPDSVENIPYFARQMGLNPEAIGQFVNKVEFEYEYRTVSSNDDDPTWRSERISGLNLLAPAERNKVCYLVHTIYVTVTSTAQPGGTDGTVYFRTLTSAVHLRTPFSVPVPPAGYHN